MLRSQQIMPIRVLMAVAVVGAIVGAAVLDSVTGRTQFAHLGVTALGPGVSEVDHRRHHV